MKLSEMKPSEYIRALLLGSPGSGKTCAAAGFPYPMLVFDFDGKINSAAAWFAGDADRLANIDVRNMQQKLDGSDPVGEMLRILREEVSPNPGKFKTIVVDSATTFSAALLRHIVNTNPGIKRVPSAQGVQPCMQDYGILKREFTRLIPGMISLPVNFVMTGHISIDKSDLTGEIIRTPNLDGSFGASLPIFFEEVYRVYMKDGKPWAQTRGDTYYDFCRSQIPGVPANVELSYANLIKKYK